MYAALIAESAKKAPPKKLPKWAPEKKRKASPKLSPKRRELERAKDRARVAESFSRAASRRFGRASKTAEGIRALSRQAQGEAALAREARSAGARRKHATAAGKAVEAIKATLYGVKDRRGGKPDARRRAKAPERGKSAKGPAWREYRDFDPRKMAEEGHHLDPQVHRMSAASLLSYLESRPGVRWPPLATRRLRSAPMNEGRLSAEEKARAQDVAKQFGLGAEDTLDLYEMLIEAEQYGLELDFEIGGYTDD